MPFRKSLRRGYLCGKQFTYSIHHYAEIVHRFEAVGKFSFFRIVKGNGNMFLNQIPCSIVQIFLCALRKWIL
jgi:hypothetical protein